MCRTFTVLVPGRTGYTRKGEDGDPTERSTIFSPSLPFLFLFLPLPLSLPSYISPSVPTVLTGDPHDLLFHCLFYLKICKYGRR